MLGTQPIIAFSATLDAPRARTFYENVLNLRLVSEDPYAIVFDANGTMLRVQKVPELAPAQHTLLGWSVRDIRAEVAELTSKGVKFEHYGFEHQDAAGVWTTPSGAKVAWFKDPDGNILSLTELDGP